MTIGVVEKRSNIAVKMNNQIEEDCCSTMSTSPFITIIILRCIWEFSFGLVQFWLFHIYMYIYIYIYICVFGDVVVSMTRIRPPIHNNTLAQPYLHTNTS